MRRDALIAGAEDGMPAVEPTQGRAAAAGIALIARRRRIAEVTAPHPLAQVAAHRGHVPQLSRRAQQQRRPEHVLAHQVDLGRATSEKRAIIAPSDRRDRAVDVGCPCVTEWPHPHSPPAASRTSRIAARMFGYAAHRQMLPLINSAICPSSGTPSSSSATADMIWPGVQ